MRVVDAFVEALDLSELGSDANNRAADGRPAYHPAALLKIYIYGCLNHIPSSRRLEREAQRNLELIWLTGRLAPDFKTLADFRKNNGAAIAAVCSRLIALCRKMKVFSHAIVAIDGSTTPLLTKTLPKVGTEISVAVLACNMKLMIRMMGAQAMVRAIAA